MSKGRSGTRPVDDIDLSILRVLAQNGRISFSDLADQVMVSRASAYSRFQRLKEDGVIQGISAQIDPYKIGLKVAVFIGLKVYSQMKRPVQNVLEAMPDVEHCVLTAGDFDLIAFVRGRSLEHIRDVILHKLNSLEGTITTTTFVVMDEMLPRASVLPATEPRLAQKDGGL